MSSFNFQSTIPRTRRETWPRWSFRCQKERPLLRFWSELGKKTLATKPSIKFSLHWADSSPAYAPLNKIPQLAYIGSFTRMVFRLSLEWISWSPSKERVLLLNTRKSKIYMLLHWCILYQNKGYLHAWQSWPKFIRVLFRDKGYDICGGRSWEGCKIHDEVKIFILVPRLFTRVKSLGTRLLKMLDRYSKLSLDYQKYIVWCIRL